MPECSRSPILEFRRNERLSEEVQIKIYDQTDQIQRLIGQLSGQATSSDTAQLRAETEQLKAEIGHLRETQRADIGGIIATQAAEIGRLKATQEEQTAAFKSGQGELIGKLEQLNRELQELQRASSTTPASRSPLDSALHKLVQGHIAFNNPKRMRVSESGEIQAVLAISIPADDLMKQLTAAGTHESSSLLVSDHMQATLIDGGAFDVASAGPQTQWISKDKVPLRCSEWVATTVPCLIPAPAHLVMFLCSAERGRFFVPA